MQIVQKKVDELIPYEKNPRKNDSAVEMVARSIKEFGLTECYGIKEARKGAWTAIASALGFIAVTQFAMLFEPNSIDIAQGAFICLFSLTPRIAIASAVLFALSNIADINLYAFIGRKTKGKYMWLRNNVSTILCNGTENFFFYTIAFLGVFEIHDIISMSVTATIIEITIALCDTPFLYLAKRLNRQT